MAGLPHILVTHPSKQSNIYRRALGAERGGFPTKLLTGFYYRKGYFPYDLWRLFPKRIGERLHKSLRSRTQEGLSDDAIVPVCGPWLELATRPWSLFGGTAAPFVEFQDDIHDRVAAKWVRRYPKTDAPVIVYGFQGSCLHTFRAARERGFITLMEITLPPCQFRIVAEERVRLGHPPGQSAPPARPLQEIKEAQYLINQSYFSIDCMRHLGANDRRMIHLPMGGDVTRYRPAEGPRPDRPFQLLFLGQLSIRKGLHHLLQAWHELALPNAKLLLVGALGDPDSKPYLDKYAGEFDYLGFVPHDRLPELFQESDAFVIPSLAEGGCNVVYEAMASGIPSIVSRNAGSAITDGVQGFVTPVGDVPALKRAILQLYENPELRARMGRAARERVQQFTWAEHERRLAGLLELLAKAGGAELPGLLDLIDS